MHAQSSDGADSRSDLQGTGSRAARRPWRWRRILLASLVSLPIGLLLFFVAFHVWRWASVPFDAPVVGVSCDTAWHAKLGISTKNYEVALIRAGCEMTVLRPGDVSPDQLLDRIDALLLAGGGDVDPKLYGGDEQHAQHVDRERDDFEIALIRGALERDMPILGVCRGIQIINVAHGGTLRDLRLDPEADQRHNIGLASFHAHDVAVVQDSKLAQLSEAGGATVSSFHGQGVDKIGAELRVVATAEDGLIEGIERPDRTFVLAIQWHPEVPPPDLAYFLRLVKEAEDYRRRRTPVGR